MVWGAHILTAYSIIGRTDVLSQCSLIDREQALRLRHRKDKAALDFDSTSLIRSFQVSLESITTPRYLKNSTSLIGT